MSIGDKVFVSDWGKQYSTFYKWIKGKRITVWEWKSHIPDYSDTSFHWKYIYEPNLTLKGTVNKREPKKLASKEAVFKSFEYTIEEVIIKEDSTKIYLLSSSEGCWIQIGEGGLSTLTVEEQEKVKHLEKERYLQALAVQNLNKWDIETANINTFPKELLKYLYDTNQVTQFGAGTTLAIIKYPYISKEYTVKGNDICLGWEQSYNGVGCDLSDKETISWHQMRQRFPEQNFN